MKRRNIISLIFKGILTIPFCLSAKPATRKKNDVLRFAQLCDTHIGYTNSKENSELMKQAVKEINKSKVDLTVVCGDLVHNLSYWNYGELKDILGKLKTPFYLSPGNHDVGMIPSGNILNRYRKLVGKDYFSFTFKSSLFIIINTQLWIKDIENETKTHDQWLRKTLKNDAVRHKNVFIIGHIPLFLNNPNEPFDQNANIPLSKRGEILNLLQNYNVTAILGGHLHKFNSQFYKDITFINGECTAVSSNDAKKVKGFRIWDIREGEALKSPILYSLNT